MSDFLPPSGGPTADEALAETLYDAGKIEAAARVLEAVLSQQPGNLAAMTRLGFCLYQLRRLEEAFEMFVGVLRRDRHQTDAHYGFALTLMNLGDQDGAAREFQFTLDLAPDHAAAWAGLAAYRQTCGDTSGARVLAEKAIAIEPHQPGANLLLGKLDLAEDDLVAVESRMRRLLAQDLSDEDRYLVLSLLGDAIDAQDRFREAFNAYENAKIRAKLAFRESFGRDSQAALEATLVAGDGFRQVSAGPALQVPTRTPQDPRQHVFLVGFPRSGTTLLEQVLASHPAVVTMEERRALPPGDVFQGEADAYQRLADLDEETRRSHREAYWTNVRNAGIDPAGKVFIDKFPLNTIKLPVIAGLFPEAKILFAIRDPRDVVLSCFRRAFAMNPAMYQFMSLDGAARFYDAVMNIGLLSRQRLHIPFYDLYYEKLIENFENEASLVCEFIGLEFDPAMHDFAETARRRRINTPSGPQVGRGLYGDGVAHWRNYAWALESVAPILRPWIEYFGYPAD